ncbi:MAG TPA: glycosyltransferase [Solirubrobacteraceae bacterium]|nr:glycosyltransferase [Solirubrobacteraceae bacterium]
MSYQRRAGAPRLIDWTGERCVPWAPDVQVVYEHLHRYMWAAPLVAGRRVLDLGSGEGFGSAILSGSAAHVVGVDIDERTIEHARLNYAGTNLEFHVGSALELSAYEPGSFGAVVAFEIIEHVRDQERVLAGIARLLADDGLLVMSTPDRRLYSEASGQRNPFHERELGQEEFLELLGEHFPHVSLRGQRTITGSHLHALDPDGVGARDDAARPAAGKPPARGVRKGDVPGAQDFYVERSGEEWRSAGDPAALYFIALASKAALPVLADNSTLADCGLELMRVKERDAVLAAGEREQLAQALERARAEFAHRINDHQAHTHAEIVQRERDVERALEDIVELLADSTAARATADSLALELAAARQLNRRTEESITWQAFQRARGRLYGAIGERSLLARAVRLSLKLAGRALIKRPKPAGAPSDAATSGDAAEQDAAGMIVIPGFPDPKVSLIIPLYAHAELTRACLLSIRRLTANVSYEVILVDDAADAGTKRLLKSVQGAKIVRNEQNLGYLRSMNRGASFARGRWLVLFNNDTEVTDGWLAAMVDCAESADDIGVVTPKFVYPDGSLNEAGGIIWRDGTGVNYGRGDSPEHFQYEYRRETDYGSAAALMVSADLWQQTGGFDERYLPMYYEDADLCFEARERGLRVMYEPRAVVVHIEGATAGNDAESGHKRHQEENRPKFVAKWRHRLESEQLRPAPMNVRPAANRHRGRHVLIVDHRVPMWDRDAGSLRMLEIMRSLTALGARVTFMSDNFAAPQPYTRALQRLGVEVLYGQLDVNAELATIGPKLSMVILSRPHTASRWLDALREFAPAATVVYDTVDLHWLREARRGALGAAAGSFEPSNGSLASMAPKAKALRELELAMIRATDATLVVSDSERVQVEQDVPGARVVIVPTVHDVEAHVPAPADRSGILFVGGFEHTPNVDAAVRLVQHVMPAVWRELGDVRVTIVGPSPPPEVQALAAPLVDVTGWVEDLRPLLDSSRLMLAPLRYGAGLKGKITQCLAVGLPVVTTPIGAEGLEGDGEQFVLVAEDARELAAHAVRAYRDDELWQELSRAGQALIERQCSTAVLTERLSGLLEDTPALLAGAVES